MGALAVSVFAVIAITGITYSGYKYGFNWETTSAYIGVAITFIVVMGHSLYTKYKK